MKIFASTKWLDLFENKFYNFVDVLLLFLFILFKFLECTDYHKKGAMKEIPYSR